MSTPKEINMDGQTYTATQNDDGSITLTPVSPIAKGYNPHKLTEAQVGVSDGWRLISEEEQRLANDPNKSLTEHWEGDIFLWNTCEDGGGFFSTDTYRTRQPEGFFLPKPERKPEEGDVWATGDGRIHLLGSERGVRIESKNPELHEYRTIVSIDEYYTKGSTYLGKFHEVYVKKSDVIAALSIKDGCGDSVLHGSSPVSYYAIQQTRDALAKMGITKGGAK